MFDVSSFLLRWMFLSNMCRNIAEIQTLPCQPYYSPQSDQYTSQSPETQNCQPSHNPFTTSQQHDRMQAASRHQREDPNSQETVWKQQCLHGILYYPPGMQRIMVIDALRLELVQQLAQKLKADEDTLKLSNESNPIQRSPEALDINAVSDLQQNRAYPSHQGEEENAIDDKSIGDPNVDIPSSNEGKGDQINTSYNINNTKGPDQALPELPDTAQYDEARRSLELARNYLPQLVSALLKSPPAYDRNIANPIHKLRELILSRCLNDPSVGIELCWLLEAEVGRTWKSLFEHRQQTGRRLIIVLPAEKAAVIAKIGLEKREAFDLLQDAEQVTAYGSPNYIDDNVARKDDLMPLYTENSSGSINDMTHHAQLPSSVSLRRCSHFGDTMHFIDRLTTISSDLRLVPEQHRFAALCDQLYELNRRIRRRMITRGDISLDVEDNRSPHDWPQVTDLSMDMLTHSVHLPLSPQSGKWPDGEVDPLKVPKLVPAFGLPSSSKSTVSRVLNIVVPETKLLSSRERCPFLIHLEVSDTDLEGSDARLYATGAEGLGSTVGEALTMSNGESASSPHNSQETPSYAIPNELLNAKQQPMESPRESYHQETDSPQVTVARGGWHNDGQNIYDESKGSTSDYSIDPFSDEHFNYIQQQEVEHLHEQLHSQSYVAGHPPRAPPYSVPKVTLGVDLLDRVFGREWIEQCQSIKQSSPYGHVKGWRLASFIMKAGEDIRREAFVMQIISKLQGWFRSEIPDAERPFMRPYTIMCVGGDAGLLECLSDSKSIDEVKKRTDNFESLRNYFERAFGPPKPIKQASQPTNSMNHQNSRQFGLGESPPLDGSNQPTVSFETAQDNFLRSIVGYSLVCYILQIKDRHNANILLDRVGHIMHIDFGFVLGDTPKMGKVPIFSERAPFKLSAEFWEVLGGWNTKRGGLGVKFCKMFEQAFACASRHADEIATLAEAALLSLDSNPRTSRTIANGVRSRLRMRGEHGSDQQKMFIMELVNAALTSWGTSTYDWLQRSMNGYQ